MSPTSKSLIVVVALSAAASFFAWRRGAEPVVAPSGESVTAERPTQPASEASAPVAAALIDQQVCADCHAEIVADFRRSGMSTSWRTAAPELVPDLDPAPVVDDLVSGYRYHVSARGGAIIQRETFPQSQSEHELTRSADYLAGSGKNAIAMVTAENGYLTQMPVAWFRHGASWKLNPGFELSNHRFRREITPGCIACHGTSAEHLPPTPNRYHLPIEDGIGCVRCHGSADQHAAFWRAADNPDDRPGTATFLHPGRLSAEQSNDVCLQCHLQGDVVLWLDGGDPFQLRPGDRLRDHRLDFLVDYGEPATLGVASHGSRMLQSRCYTASNGQLTCILCHDAHRPASDFDVAHYDSKCVTCHTPQSCSRVTPPNEARSAGGCVACHMPQRASQEGIHLVFTDHAILRHKPPPDRVASAPTVLPPDCAPDLISCWPGHEVDPAELGAALVLLHETMGPQVPSLQRARRLLEEVVRYDADDVESRFWLGSACVALGRGREARRHLEEVVGKDGSRHAARFRLGLACELVNDFRAAAAHYEMAIESAPSWMEPYPRLAQIYLSQQPAAAVRLLNQQLSYRNDALARAQLALAQRLAGGTHASAMETVHEALRLDPRLPTAYLYRATLLLLIGKSEQAKADYQHVLTLDAGNPQALQALRSFAD